MLLKGLERTNSRALLLIMAVVLISALVGIWHADETEKRRLADIAVDSNPSQDLEEKAYLLEMERALAQAGCPGWIPLASEGESAFDPPEQVEQVSHFEPTVKRQAKSEIPRIIYPTPLRVASARKYQLAERTARPMAGSPDDPDDLLDGMPDLLRAADDKAEETAEDEPKSNSSDSSAPVAESEASSEPEPKPEFDSPEMPKPALQRPKKVIEQAPRPATPQAKPEPQSSESLILKPTPTQQEVVPAPVGAPQAVETLDLPTPTESPSPFSPPPTPAAPHTVSTPPEPQKQQSRCEFVADQCYPSAETCSKCHEKIYDEWRVSSHAYAAISPMFHKFEQKISEVSQGTVGYFCYRCHNPVGTTMGLSRSTPLWELPQVAREGVTCIACHRVNQRYSKVNGDRRIEPGNIHAPVYGSIGGGGIAEAIARKDEFKVKTSPHEPGPGQPIHNSGYYFDQLHKPEFCVSCHQVAVHPGIKLEVVWEQYRASPACKKGISCQDCHMGRLPGVPSGYEVGAAAVVNGKSVNKQRKHANHVFYGPGYSIAHPGIFPHNPKANRWSMRDWLLFDYRNGWGTDEFEERIVSGQIRMSFPSPWQEADDRYDAREIVEENQAKLAEKAILRQQLMENGSHVDGPFFNSMRARGQELNFHYIITNTNEGHNLPSGSLGAQPQLWANVVLVGPRGNRIWESGYTDRWGDVADIHSVDVRQKRIPYDWQLFNLQTMFLITGAKGTDREFFLPVNVDFDQLPFLRPGAQPISVINHPPFIRMEGRSLAPLGSRKVPYKVPGHLLQEPGCYRLSFRMRSRAEPIYFMRFCDATKEMQRAMNEWMIDFHQSSVEFVIR